MIFNGSCPNGLELDTHGNTGKNSPCLGNTLSIPSWLAILGVEFVIFGSFILPHLQALITSKLLTRKLLKDGLLLPEF
jgi:hypothetical protein